MRIKPYRIVTIIATTTLAFLFYNSSFALEYQTSADLNFTINPSITVTLSSSDLIIDELSSGISQDSNSIVVNVLTNNISGYYLSSTVGNSSYTSTSLINNANNDYTFTSLPTNASLSDLGSLIPGTWGYSYATTTTDDGNGNTSWNWSNYSGLPLYTNAGVKLSEKYTPSDDDISFKIAAYATNVQASGEYNNVINFTATAYPYPLTLSEAYAYFNKQKVDGYYTMQDMTPGICAVAEDNSTMQAIDLRDHNVYTIAKINGNCWMTQNLRTIGTVSAEYSNFTGDDFNMSQGDLDETIGTCSGAECNSYTTPMTHDSNDNSKGVWYNYAAATAGTITGDSGAETPRYDICPANWSLPSHSQQLTTVNYLSSFMPASSGSYHNGIISVTAYGFYWGTTPRNTAQVYILQYADLSRLHGNAYGRDYGLSVRCIANN